MSASAERIAEGTLVGLALGADGKPEIVAPPWRGCGFAKRPSGRPFHRAALFAEHRRARLELTLPAGEWRLAFVRHAWSGQILLRDAAGYAFHDLYAPLDAHGEYEAAAVSHGPDDPVVIEATGLRHPEGLAAQCWLIEARRDGCAYFPESGRAVSPSCRLIEAKRGVFLALRSDSGVAEELASTGLWEEGQAQLFARLARPGETVLDVGANIGCHTVALSQIVGEAGKVLAFEPQMAMFNLLNANIVLNHCRNVLPFRLAAGSGAAKARMGPVSYDDFLPFGSLGLQNQPGGAGESVDVVRLDDLLPTLELGAAPVSLIKIDVQAHELFVLKGAEALLRRERPSISFEAAPFWMRKAGYDWREILELLRGLGYSFYDEAGAPFAAPEWDGRSLAEWQVLAVHERYRERLPQRLA
jgi:FkbM family methyltransferase